MPRMFFRADGGGHIGWGHVRRCLALAEWAMADGYEAVFISAILDNSLQAAIEAQSIQVEKPEEGIAWTESLGLGDILILDVRKDAAKIADAARGRGAVVLVLDDLGDFCGSADILLNQNMDACQVSYASSCASRMLLGPKYALLEMAFAKAYPPLDARDCLLLVLGGAADRNMIGDILARIIQWPGPVLVAAGSSDLSGLDVPRKVRILDDALTLGLMQQACLGVCGGGTVTWQLACMGVPMVIVQVGQDQAGNAKDLAQSGCARNLGWWEQADALNMGQVVLELWHDAHQRKRMSDAARRLVDGQGCARVLACLKELITEKEVG